MGFNKDYSYCEGHGVRVPLVWLMPDFDEPLFLGSYRLPPIVKNFVPEIEGGLECNLTIGYVLAKANDLERRSRDLLKRLKAS